MPKIKTTIIPPERLSFNEWAKQVLRKRTEGLDYIQSPIIRESSRGRTLNIPYAQAKFYFGKYKDYLVSEVNDIEYLSWFLQNVKCSASMIEAIENQLYKLSHGNKQ